MPFVTKFCVYCMNNRRNKMQRKRIVITGIGPIASPGIGKEALWDGVLNGRTGIEKVIKKIEREEWTSFYLHRIKNFDIKNYGIKQSDLDYIRRWKENRENRDLFLMLAATKLALDDSKIDYKKDTDSLAMVACHENPCLEQYIWETLSEALKLKMDGSDKEMSNYFNAIFNKSVKTGYETQSFMLLFHLAKVFKIHEYSLHINNACASGLYALETASDMIRMNKASHVIVVAGDCPDVFKFLWFNMIGMYENDGEIKPFAKGARGLVMGECGVAMVLEDYEKARRRKAHIYAEYLGGGFRLEGWGVTTPRIGDTYLHDAINDSLRNSRVKIKDIDLICAHGASTASADYYEAKAIQDLFGKNVPVCVFKPYIGHTLGASTLIEMTILLLSMEHKLIPAMVNTKELDDRININLIRQNYSFHGNTILKTCDAFAGYNAAVILKKI